jgi:hypothetical protein
LQALCFPLDPAHNLHWIQGHNFRSYGIHIQVSFENDSKNRKITSGTFCCTKELHVKNYFHVCALSKKKLRGSALRRNKVRVGGYIDV